MENKKQELLKLVDNLALVKQDELQSKQKFEAFMQALQALSTCIKHYQELISFLDSQSSCKASCVSCSAAGSVTACEAIQEISCGQENLQKCANYLDSFFTKSCQAQLSQQFGSALVQAKEKQFLFSLYEVQ